MTGAATVVESMTAQDLQFDDLSPLLAALCDGSISDEDFLRLQQVLLASARARTWYINYMDLHGDLICGQVINSRPQRRGEIDVDVWPAADSPLTEGPGPLPSLLDEYPICMSPPHSVAQGPSFEEEDQPVDDHRSVSDGGFLVQCARPIIVQLSGEGVLPWLAAVVIFSAMVFAISRWDLPAPSSEVAVSDQEPPPAAWVTLLHEVEWADGQQPYGWGWEVKAGHTLRLKSGLARLVFSSGAEVLLEGPVTFTAETADSGRLRRGKLVARAETDQAQGFTIRTPTAQIVDLGTEFGVTVDEQGRTETHVFAGHVLAQAIGVKRATSEPLRLKSGQVARVESRGIQLRRVAASPETFVRRSPPRKLSPLLHYTMEEAAGPLIDQAGRHPASENGGGGFLYRQPGVPPGTYGAVSVGPGGTGFSAGLKNATSQWRLDAAGTAKLNLVNNFTVMTWLYLPETPSGIVKVVGQSATKPTCGWAFGVREAAMGRGVCFGGSGIEDFYSGASIPWAGGRWHHMAVTKSTAEGIRLYLDGNLVAADNRPTARGNFARLASNDVYSLGRGNDYVKELHNGRRIDEFRVYNTVLTREEIIAAASVP